MVNMSELKQYMLENNILITPNNIQDAIDKITTDIWTIQLNNGVNISVASNEPPIDIGEFETHSIKDVLINGFVFSPCVIIHDDDISIMYRSK